MGTIEIRTSGYAPQNFYCELPDTAAGHVEARRLLDVLSGRPPGRTKRLTWRWHGEEDGWVAYPAGAVLSEDGCEWPCARQARRAE